MNVITVQGEYEKNQGFHYEYDRDSVPLGEGGMGRIFQGYVVDNASGKYSPVAIKEIREEVAANPELMNRARRESSVQIDDDHLLRMYGFIPNKEVNPTTGLNMIRYYMVMERLVGVDLEHVLSSMTYDKSGIAVMYAQEIYQMYNSDKKSAVITIMNGLLSGLRALHAHGYIHRDIDPSNIMITLDRKIKLIDYGVSKQINSGTSSSGEGTKVGSFIGKVNYAAPELAIGDIPNQSFRTDIYAAGVLLYQLYVGHLPFSGTNQEILQSHLTKDIPVKDIDDKGTRETVKKATAKKPDDRYPSADAMMADLNRLVSPPVSQTVFEQSETHHMQPQSQSQFNNAGTVEKSFNYGWLYPIAAIVGLFVGIALKFVL